MGLHCPFDFFGASLERRRKRRDTNEHHRYKSDDDGSDDDDDDEEEEEEEEKEWTREEGGGRKRHFDDSKNDEREKRVRSLDEFDQDEVLPAEGKHPGVPERNRREKRRDSERESAVFGRTASRRRRERGRYHRIERDVPAVGKRRTRRRERRVWHVASFDWQEKREE